MADAGFFKGTSADQDRRFSDKEMKLLRSMKFPPEFDKKVDMRKVNLTVIRPWVTKKIIELIGFEDEVVVEYAMGLIDDESQPIPDPRKMQINLTGFLTKDTPAFMHSLWKLLLEAQDEITGVPRTFVEQKKEEMRKAREFDTRAIDERDRRVRLDEIRDSERGGRGGGRGRGRGGGGGRGRGGFDGTERDNGRMRDSGWGQRGGGPSGPPPRRRNSRSPPPRRRSRSITPKRSRSPPPGRRYRGPPRRRSPQDSRSRSGSRSPSPPPRRRSSPVRRPTPPRRPSSRSISRSPPPNRRRPRSPSASPPRERERGKATRSPPRRRRASPVSVSRSRSRSPPRKYARRRSRSPSIRKRSITPPRRRRSPSYSRSPSPHRGNENKRPAQRSSRSLSTASSVRSSPRNARRENGRMGIDSPSPSGELKIKGQAAAEQKRSRWEDEDNGRAIDLAQRENELKEKALRNKVMRTRKKT